MQLPITVILLAYCLVKKTNNAKKTKKTYVVAIIGLCIPLQSLNLDMMYAK